MGGILLAHGCSKNDHKEKNALVPQGRFKLKIHLYIYTLALLTSNKCTKHFHKTCIYMMTYISVMVVRWVEIIKANPNLNFIAHYNIYEETTNLLTIFNTLITN